MAVYATRGKLNCDNYQLTETGVPDVAVFDFTLMYMAEHSAKIFEKYGKKLLISLVGDSLVEVGDRLAQHVCTVLFPWHD